MIIKAKRHKIDTDMVELYCSDNMLMAVCHIDCFGTPIGERLYGEEDTTLHVGLAVNKAEELFDILTDNGFDKLNSEEQVAAAYDLDVLIAEFADNGWQYEKFLEVIQK